MTDKTIDSSALNSFRACLEELFRFVDVLEKFESISQSEEVDRLLLSFCGVTQFMFSVLQRLHNPNDFKETAYLDQLVEDYIQDVMTPVLTIAYAHHEGKSENIAQYLYGDGTKLLDTILVCIAALSANLIAIVQGQQPEFSIVDEGRENINDHGIERPVQ